MIACSQEWELPVGAEFCRLNKLALTGAVRPVRGVLPAAPVARNVGARSW